VVVDAGVVGLSDGGTCNVIGNRCVTGNDCCSAVCFGGFCEPGIN
jgi:hypothetical protein